MEAILLCSREKNVMCDWSEFLSSFYPRRSVHSQVRLCWLSPMREPYANIKNSALSYTSNSRILVPVLKCLEETSFLFSSSSHHLSRAQQEARGHRHPSLLCPKTRVLFLREVRMEKKDSASLLSLPVNRDGVQAAEYAFPDVHAHRSCWMG